jgi:fructose/tagatose bisphosphate aldolase
MTTHTSSDFERALSVGRPPNIQKLFPNSKALLVSGKVVDRALRAKAKAMTIAANARNLLVIRGALQAAQRANAAIIIEIAKSEGGSAAYCGLNYWNLAKHVDGLCNEMNITVPVAVHADHYGIKNDKDLEKARVEVPTLFEYGITSIAIDASHLPDDRNLLTNLELSKYIPAWSGLESEVGEIKGAEGLSTVEEALFLIQGLNAHEVFPDWIALNNGTAHGIQTSDQGIQVELTKEIHQALQPYQVSGAQHGTSGNSTERLRTIAQDTKTTKANVATALQMISWGVKVNDYGNAELDDQGGLVKVPGRGMDEGLWAEMMAFAQDKGWSGGKLKQLSLPFDNKILSQPRAIRDRMEKDVESFVYHLLTEVFDARDTAPMAIQAILEKNSYDMGPLAQRTEDPAQWTPEKIQEKAKSIVSDKGPEGDFDD